MPLLDDINEAFRDFAGWDAQNPLPRGNPRTGVHNIQKDDLRRVLVAILQTMGNEDALQTILLELDRKASTGQLDSVRQLLDRVTRNALRSSPNLFDKDSPDYVVGAFVNHSNGTIASNSSYDATGFISVTGGATYYLMNKSFIAWYNAAREYIGGSPSSDANNVQVAPPAAAFLRASILKAAPGGAVNRDTFYVAAGNQPLYPYVPFGGQLITTGISGLGTGALADRAVTPAKTDFLTIGKNLFNKSTRTLNAIQSSSGVIVNASNDLSDYILVEEGKTYQYRSGAGGARFRACFDASRNIISGQAAQETSSSYTVPLGSGVRFMRLSIDKARVDGFQVEEGAAPTGFEPYGYRFTDAVIPVASAGTSPWVGVETASFGDSISAQQSWQPLVAREHGLLHTAYGVGGRQISMADGMSSDAAIATIPLSTQLLLVLGGTNDWAQSRALGVPASTNTGDFWGAVNEMCRKLTVRLPSARIVLLTTPYGEMPGRVVNGIWTSATTNTQGLTTRDYAEVIRQAGKRWNFPVIDLSRCGWNEVNIFQFMLDDSGHGSGGLHPNASGGRRIAEVVSGELWNLAPLAA